MAALFFLREPFSRLQGTVGALPEKSKNREIPPFQRIP
jgi:hypothetical protein